MSEWKEYNLGEIASFSQGLQVDPELQMQYKSNNYVRFIRIVDYSKKGTEPPRYIENPGEKYLVEEDDLVMIRYGSQTAGHVVRGLKGAIANNTFKIILNEYIADKAFLYYYLSQEDIHNYFMISQASSTMPAITFSMMNQLSISLPTLPEQKQIASILSSLDDKIDLLNRENKTLEIMAETLFRKWFVEDANNGTLEQFISIQNGYAFKSKDFQSSEGKNRVIKIKNISGGIVNVDNTDFIDAKVASSIQKRFKLTEGDIIIAMTGAEIGKLGIIPKTKNNLWLNQRVGLLSEKYKGSKYLAYMQLKSDFGQDYIENTATGSAQPNISGIGIEKCGFPVLLEVQIKEYSIQIGELYDKVNSNISQIRFLSQLRDTLLPKLMNGEVRVKEKITN